MPDNKRNLAILEPAPPEQSSSVPRETATPQPEEPRLFAAELELERKTSTWVPLLLLLMLIAGMVGALAYFVVRARVQVTPSQAAAVVIPELKARKPPVMEFRTGTTWYTETWGTSGAKYRLMQKAGLLQIESRQRGEKVALSLTPKGKQMLAQIPGVIQEKQNELTAYKVPLATRELMSIEGVTMVNPERARVDYTWKWVPNSFGDIFDYEGKLIRSLNIGDRGYLIQNGPANDYHGGPFKNTVTIAQSHKGWQLALD